MSELPSEHTCRYFLTAGETNAEGLMPMTLIISRSIEVATEHANILGIGYSALLEHGIGWVLARITVEMIRYPRINEEYSFTTWIESINRMYSDRCFQINDAQGEVIGNVRSMWFAIDMNKRSAADLTVLPLSALPKIADRCPMPKPRKVALPAPTRTDKYTFRYTDIDFNRHVNTIQYVRIALNQWSMEQYDNSDIAYFDISFHQECYHAETVDVKVEDGDVQSKCEIAKADGTRAVMAALQFKRKT